MYGGGVKRSALAFLIAAACGPGETTGSPPAADARPPSDAAARIDASGAAADARSASCLERVPPSYGSPQALDESNIAHAGGDFTYFAELDPEPFERLFIRLNADMGVFAGGPVAPGTYVLEGNESDYQWCGACVYLAVLDGQSPSTLYMARTGKLEISSVGSEIHGSLSGAILRQIEIVYGGDRCGGGGPWPCGNTGCQAGQCGVQFEVAGCETRVDSFDF